MRYIHFMIRLSLLCIAMFFLIACQDKEDEPQQINYHITFISNGGSSLQPIYALSDSSLLEPNEPIREGFIFLGWYYDETLEEPVTWPIILDQNITLYAKWQIENTHQFFLSYYEMKNIQISKIFPITMVNKGSDRTFLFLSSEGRLYERIEIYNQLTYQMDYVFMELPISKHPQLSQLNIVDVIVYEPVYLIKVETGEWFGIEMGPYATGDFLGVVHELISIDFLLNLDPDEQIAQMYHVGRFFYAYTTENKVFLAGVLEIDGEIIHTFDTPLDITDEFELDEDEYFIPHDELLAISGNQELTLKTNKRTFIPTSIAAIMMNQPSLLSHDKVYIDINDLHEQTYIGVFTIVFDHQYHLYVLTENQIIIHTYIHNTHELNIYDLNPHQDETFTLFANIPISNQNRIYYEPNRYLQLEIPSILKELLVGVYSLDQAYIHIGPIFVSEENHYYDAYEGVYSFFDMTDLVSSYTFINGFWMKDDTYYLYDHINKQMVKNEYVSLSLVQESVNHFDTIHPPNIDDHRYHIQAYDYVTVNENNSTTLYVTPLIHNPILKYTYIYIYIDNLEVTYRYEQLPIDRIFTIEDFIEYLYVLNPDDVVIDLSQLDLNHILINDELFDHIEINTYQERIQIYFQTKD